MPHDDESSFKFLTENSADMIFRSDLTPKITYVSPSCFRLLGKLPEEFIGVGPEACVYPEDLRLVDAHIAALCTPGSTSSHVAVRMWHGNGSLVWMEVSGRMVADEITGRPKELILIARDITERKRLEDQLITMALTDGLTGLHNRRAFDAELQHEWNRVLHEESQLSLVLLDIDHFKKFNDQYGHIAGDDCLRVVAAAVRSAVRATDMVARYGGEELAIILPLTDFTGAIVVAEMARRAIEGLNIPHTGSPEGRITASLGVATALARVGAGVRMPDSLILSADKALYMAKHEGRNCVREVMMLTAATHLSEVA